MEKATGLERPPQSPRVSILLPGLYAWAITVALPASAAHAPWWARVPAGIACICLLLAPFAGVLRPGFEVVLGLYGFLGFSLACWAALGSAGLSLAPHGVIGAFGAFGWMLFAFAWGELRDRRIPENDPHVLGGTPLAPRQTFRRSAEWVLGFGMLSAGLLLLLAWRIERPSHAVFGQAAALLASLLVVAAATRVALERQPREFPSSSQRYDAAAGSVAVLLLLLGLGMIFWVLEH